MKKHFFDKSLITPKGETYLTLIIFFVSFLNFLSGINIDLYAPSMPAITIYFNTSIMATKNTITMTFFGWAFGAILLGVLIDSVGRKRILIFSLLSYTIVSFLAIFSQSIEQLMLVRVIQGFTMAAVSIGCRALVVDNIIGPRYAIAILYTSIGYGVGPIIGPYIGGMLQHYIGWQANFVFLAIISTILLTILLVLIQENIKNRQPLVLGHIALRGYSIIKDKQFISGVFISGLLQIQIMIYPTVGPFIVENELHKSVLVYGNTALLVGASYLTGALINRLLLEFILPKYICYFASILLLIGLIISILFAALDKLSLLTLILPISIICISAGLFFANIISENLKRFSYTAGVAMAIQGSLLLLIAALGIFIINWIHIVSLIQLVKIFMPLVFLQLIAFFSIYRKIFD